MKISIVTANYNYGHFLKTAIQNVFDQVVSEPGIEVEHIVIDGGSTDGTLEILKDWEGSLQKQVPEVLARYAFRWVSEPDKGQTDAINKGLRLATGDVVCWLNADEYYLPGALSKVAKAFEQNPKADFIYGEPLFVDAENKPIRIKRDHPFSGFVLLWYGCYITSCCSFWRRRIQDDGVYLDDSYKVVMDLEYWARLMKLGYRFKFLPANLAAFTWHDSNVSSVYNNRRIQEEEKIKLLYAPMVFQSLRLRRMLLSVMKVIARQCRRVLILFRLVFLPQWAFIYATQTMDSTSSVQPSKKTTDGKRLRILLSCYSCGPDRGSEPGIGWNVALALADSHEIHVLTTSEFQEEIEAKIQAGDLPEGLHFHFFEIPLGRWMWRHATGLFIRLHYMLWQRMAASKAKQLHMQFHFDTAQHIPFVYYCGTNILAGFNIPYILGPVGGAETSPPELAKTQSLKGRFFEVFRSCWRWLGEHSPRALRTIRSASCVLAVTPQTYERCIALGSSPGQTQIYSAVGLPAVEFDELAKTTTRSGTLCFFGFGRLINWKRYDLAIRAFARAAISDSCFLLIGGGPEEERLKALAKTLGIADRLEITGFVPRDQALASLAQTHVLIHPSFHDSGGWVCLESMAAGRPVVCLDWAGPGLLVTDEAGIKIPVGDEDSVVQGLADAMRRLVDETLRKAKGEAAKRHVRENYLWSSKAAYYANLHRQIVIKGEHHAQ
ncbi:MAG: glycosyltransferase [Kiritimatiellia bacterium]|jgi:glycosyltransferase involved in cell wall biosynthesis